MDLLSGLWGVFSGFLENVLPMSPFSKFLNYFASLPFLGYLNWFIPVKPCLMIFVSYLGAVALFYLYSIILRWIKAIGG